MSQAALLSRFRLEDERAAAFLVFTAALLIRLAHNGYMTSSPLYHAPLGGHLPYILMAREIMAGDWLPGGAGAFSVNSPLYPYILAFLYSISGGEDFFVVRHFGIAADSLTCALVAVLAFRNFGALAGYVSGAIAAFYGPMIFYSAELMATVYTVFFLTLAVFVLDRDGGPARYFLSGILFGAATGTRPNLLLAALLAMAVPYVLGRDRKALKAAALAAGTLLAIAPITAANYVKSGDFVPLTLSGGHNLYLGHNPKSNAGYMPPPNYGGDIFENMKSLAEEAEGRAMEDTEVSSYYTSKAIENILSSPRREAVLLAEKAAASVNDYEATTYADYYFQQEFSPILAHAPGFGLVFPLAALGMTVAWRRYTLLIPVIATFATLLVFFYISRLRMPMAPFLIVFAGGGVSFLAAWALGGKWKIVAISAAAMAALFVFCNLELVTPDSSNEWNKAGVVLRSAKRYDQAMAAFRRAIEENPSNPNSYLNLAVIYEKMGYPDKAMEMRQAGRNLQKGVSEYEKGFKGALMN